MSDSEMQARLRQISERLDVLQKNWESPYKIDPGLGRYAEVADVNVLASVLAETLHVMGYAYSPQRYEDKQDSAADISKTNGEVWAVQELRRAKDPNNGVAVMDMWVVWGGDDRPYQLAYCSHKEYAERIKAALERGTAAAATDIQDEVHALRKDIRILRDALRTEIHMLRRATQDAKD